MESSRCLLASFPDRTAQIAFAAVERVDHDLDISKSRVSGEEIESSLQGLQDCYRNLLASDRERRGGVRFPQTSQSTHFSRYLARLTRCASACKLFEDPLGVIAFCLIPNDLGGVGIAVVRHLAKQSALR